MAVDLRRLDANGLAYYFQEVGLKYDQKYVSKTDKRVKDITISDQVLTVKFTDESTQQFNLTYQEATSNNFGVMKIYSTTGQNVDGTMTQKAISDAIANVYHYRGTVSTYSQLPTSNVMVGDVYNIETEDQSRSIAAGDNVAWNGSSWDNLSGLMTLPTASASKAGITKLYTASGSAIDGTMTQKAITDLANSISTTVNNNKAGSVYGVCSTAAATAAKVVTTGTSFILGTGARATIKFTYANTVASPTLNVNNTGAKYIFANGHQLTANSNLIVANGIYDLVYDGAHWEMINITNVPKEAGIIDFYTV